MSLCLQGFLAGYDTPKGVGLFLTRDPIGYADGPNDFVEAQGLWDDPDLLEIPAGTEDERRFLVIGRIEKQHWSGVITYRGENIRIISVRRSRAEEVELYES